MAATQTVPQQSQDRNSPILITPRQGVVTLFGYGTSVRVDRGHLILEDGIGSVRRYARFPRVNHGLRRLVVIGADGFVSLAALRWLADQDASFVMLERDGSVLITTGPVRPSDARLRRTQALACQSEVGLRIGRELIGEKLARQEALARDVLGNCEASRTIASARAALASAATFENIRYIEAQGGHAYWSAWRSVPIMFPKTDLHRVPDHWRIFGSRMSPLTRSPRLAANPPNAILNYLYAILEAEAGSAVAALGLDPGLGFLHMDTPTRDSLACDLMEPVRPQVDAYLLNWITRETVRREWFFEERDGNCRLMGSFAARLSESAPTWARAVAPLAERLTRELWLTRPKPIRSVFPATRLTGSHKRVAKGAPSNPAAVVPPRPPAVCRTCGAPIKFGRTYCAPCGVTASREGLIEAAKVGRLVAHSPEVCARQAEKQRQHNAAAKAWNPSDKPDWLTEKVYCEKIRPRLAGITVGVIASALDVSQPYATHIRKGTYVPHARHWQALAKLVGFPIKELRELFNY
ncbi:MAG TPA: CRISPR-associated endonuclease Cas1 [Candidatus Acidoferrum sp.]|nr:CRISPR-associated endonuclease Cas1 [Candidatus Acidoferrum sp.]